MQATKTSTPLIVHTKNELNVIERKHPIAAVFTMGALHEGHAQLMDEARKYVDQSGNKAGTVIVTVFVNPTQFDDPEDFAKYPHTLESDIEVCAKSHVDVVFVPKVSEIYPDENVLAERISAGPLGNILEGAARPGHFDAVLTVVNRLIQITKPDVMFFGEKDFQQLVLVRQMVTQLDLPVAVIGVPTVRDIDGLALSSRNKKLSTNSLKDASRLYEALTLAQQRISEGKSLTDIETECTSYLQAIREIELDYFEILNESLQVPKPNEKLRAVVAAKIGGVRLIDNISIER